MSSVEPVPDHLSHVPAHSRAGLEKMNEGKPLAALNGDAQPILDRLEQGESATDIARSLGINRVSLYAFLVRYAPDQWQAVATARQLSRLDECEDTLDSPLATQTKYTEDGEEYQVVDARIDGAIVTRARDKSRMAQWHLERANRKLFGQDKGLSIQINNVTSIERVIIAEPNQVIEGEKGEE